MYFKNLTGKKFGRLTVVKHVGSDRNNQALWLCDCDCGNEHIVTGHSLLRGAVKSCGCLKNDLSSARLKIHGKSNTRLYDIWTAMKQRCYNKRHSHYLNYGGRGITICDEWKTDFKNFYCWAIANGYSDSLTIDRINNDGNYEPSNCRWITNFEQQQKRTNTHIVEYKGELFTLSQLARKYNIKPNVLERRIKCGWEIEKSLYTPVRSCKRKETKNI